jgi:hypothetical protein
MLCERNACMLFVFVYMLLALHLVYPASYFISVCILPMFSFYSKVKPLGTFGFPLSNSAVKLDCDREIVSHENCDCEICDFSLKYHHTHRLSNCLSTSSFSTS